MNGINLLMIKNSHRKSFAHPSLAKLNLLGVKRIKRTNARMTFFTIKRGSARACSDFYTFFE